MISKINRFHGRNSLNYVYRTGRTYRSGYIGVRYVTSKRSDYRLAVVVSKKVSKSAVVRNRIRRRYYEAVRNYMLEKDAIRLDIVITVYDERVLEADSIALTNSIKQIFDQAL